MDKKDVDSLQEFLAMAKRVHQLLIEDQLFQEGSTIQHMCDSLEAAAVTTGNRVSFAGLIVFIDQIYSMRDYKPFHLPHVTVDWLVGEALQLHAYAKSRA